MSAAALLAQVRALGVRIRISGDNIALRPIAAVPDSLKAALKAAKPELLALLQTGTARPAATPVLSEPTPYPDPAAIAGRAAALLAEAEINPAVRIRDPDKASQYVRARALAEAEQAHTNDPENVVRLRSTSWPDIRDEPQPGDRCGACGGDRWWSEGMVKRGWRCAVCHPPPAPFGVRWVQT